MSTLGLTPGLGPSSAEQRIAQRLTLEAKLKGAAAWFYWIAVLSLINTIIMMSGGKLHFIFGMGTTTVVDVIAQKAGGPGVVAGLVVNLFLAAACAAFGVMGSRRMAWAMWLGMVLYAIDGVLLLLFQDWLSAAFHIWALIRIYQGIPVIAELKAFEGTPAAIAASGSPIT